MMSTETENEARCARTVTARVMIDNIDNFLSKMHNDVFPRLKAEVGIRRMYLLQDAKSKNEFVSLTLWNTKLDAYNYGSSEAFRGNIGSVRDLVESEPSILEYDIESHVINSQDLPPPASVKIAAKADARKSRSLGNRKKSSKRSKRKPGRRNSRRSPT